MFVTLHNHQNQSTNLRVLTDRTDNEFKASIFGLAILLHNLPGIQVNSGVNGDNVVIGNQTFYIDANVIAGAAFAEPYAPDLDITLVSCSASELIIHWQNASSNANHRCVGGDATALFAQVCIPFSTLGDGFSKSGTVASYTLDGSPLTTEWMDSTSWVPVGDEPPVPPDRLEVIIGLLEAHDTRVFEKLGNIDAAAQSVVAFQNDTLSAWLREWSGFATSTTATLGDIYDAVQKGKEDDLIKIRKDLANVLSSLQNLNKRLTLLSIGNIATTVAVGGSHG